MKLEGTGTKECLSFEESLKGGFCSQHVTPGKARSGGMWQWEPYPSKCLKDLYLISAERTRSKEIGGLEQ